MFAESYTVFNPILPFCCINKYLQVLDILHTLRPLVSDIQQFLLFNHLSLSSPIYLLHNLPPSPLLPSFSPRIFNSSLQGHQVIIFFLLA